jgi:hypothetical protein
MGRAPTSASAPTVSSHTQSQLTPWRLGPRTRNRPVTTGYERTVAALAAKGYDFRFIFSKATRRCDGKVFRHTLTANLVWTGRDYKAK